MNVLLHDSLSLKHMLTIRQPHSSYRTLLLTCITYMPLVISIIKSSVSCSWFINYGASLIGLLVLGFESGVLVPQK